MKNIAGWVGASAIITVLWGACTVTTDDGGGAGHAGTGGSSTGTGGTSSTGGAGGAATGGSAGATVTDAKVDAAPISACQACGNQTCSAETLACTQDTAGCGRVYQDFYDCISMTQDIDNCALMFVIEVNQVDGGASRLDALATCLKGPTCEPICLAPPDGG